MNIAVIGWGSLIWCPGCLKIRTRWRKSGPLLPIEFARVSDDGRLTLVIHPASAPQRTYWALSAMDDLLLARKNLQEREGCLSLIKIHCYPPALDSPPITPDVSAAIHAWLLTNPGVEVAIWTGLTTNWWDKFNREFSVDEAVGYLDGLEAEHEISEVKFKRAREYVMNTPVSVQTQVRARMREKGWADAHLADALFEQEEA